MTREELLDKICPTDTRDDCYIGRDCDKCYEKLNAYLDEYDKQIRADERKEAVLWVRKLIKIFLKDWNMQSTKKLSKFAFDELDEFILQQADESNGRIFMEQIKQIEGFYGLKGDQ